MHVCNPVSYTSQHFIGSILATKKEVKNFCSLDMSESIPGPRPMEFEAGAKEILMSQGNFFLVVLFLQTSA